MGSVIKILPSEIIVKVVNQKNEAPKSNPIHLAIAQLKFKDRLEWLIEKATEASIATITIFKGDKSERYTFNQERLDKITISALKQSGNLTLPLITYQESLQNVLNAFPNVPVYLAYTPEDEQHHLIKLYQPTQPGLIVIGPEGDFSTKEMDFIQNNVKQGADIKIVSLGNIRYRAETAGISALFMMKTMQYHVENP
jgi:16S rRNA (uracil1498-N3)-methyltransferase